jgi:hypothetical protein
MLVVLRGGLQVLAAWLDLGELGIEVGIQERRVGCELLKESYSMQKRGLEKMSTSTIELVTKVVQEFEYE